jgi:hypothetical protein
MQQQLVEDHDKCSSDKGSKAMARHMAHSKELAKLQHP